MDAGAQFGLRGPKIGKAGDEMAFEIAHIVGPAVGERGFELGPDALVGIEVGSIGGEVFHMKAGMGGDIFLYRLSPVGNPAVPEDDDMSGDVADEVAQEGEHLLLADVVGIELEVERDVFADGAYRDAGDGAQAVMAQAVEEKGSLPFGRPGAPDGRDEQKAGLVYEDDMGAQPAGVFLARGQSSASQRSVSAWSRSRARLSGFWWLQPICLSNRPMWSRWYVTPKVRSITSAMRAVVQRSVLYPAAKGPLRSTFSSSRFCFAVSLGGLPEALLTLRASSPPSSLASRQRITLEGAHPTSLPTSFRERPSSRSSRACLRRYCNESAEPLGRIMDTTSWYPLLHYLYRCR